MSTVRRPLSNVGRCPEGRRHVRGRNIASFARGGDAPEGRGRGAD